MTAMFPLAVWQPGTLQPSTPVNDNALRVEVLQRGAISILSTPPGSPADGDVHIVGASPTGAWSTFAQHDVVMWRSGTWYRFAPFTGWLKQVGSDVRRFTGTAWDVVSGGSGGAVPIQDEGTTVVATPTAINFVGAGVTTTDSSGVATVTIPGTGAAAWKWSGRVTALAGSSAISTVGLAGPTTTGSTGAGVISTSSYFTSLPRRNNSATASTTAVTGLRGADGLIYFLGPSAGIGGFEMSFVYGVGTGATVSSHRLFIGLRDSTAAATDAEPSSYTNIIGIGYDSADTQLQIMHNDATGAATKVALGASFPKPSTADQTVYLLELTSIAGSGEVTYRVTALNSGAVASGTITTNLPAATQGLNHWSQMSAGGTSTTVQLTFTDFNVRRG